MKLIIYYSVIARNPHTPPDTLYFLAFEYSAGDKYECEAIRMDVASNPNIPEDIIKRLAIDDSKDVRFVLARNNKTPKDIRENLKIVKGALSRLHVMETTMPLKFWS